MKINTVEGPIKSEDLGITLSHEHMIANFTNWWTPPQETSKIPFIDAEITLENISELRRNNGVIKDNYTLDDVDLAIEELKPFKKSGGQSIIELTLPGAGRDVLAMKRISEATGIAIVCGTGWYVESTHPPLVKKKSVEELAEIMIEELVEGIGDTGIRAGIIGEIGCSFPFHPDEAKVLQAVARAQTVTGACVSIHCPSEEWRRRYKKYQRDGQRYLDIIEKEGGNLERVIMLHMDHYNREKRPQLGLNIEYNRKILERGVTIAYDAFGRYQRFTPDGMSSPTDRERIAAIVELCDQGYDGKIVISQDVFLKKHLTRYGGQGYAFILDFIVPALKFSEVSDKGIRNILEENPKRLLSF